jgi:peptidoglycan/LPS O-acetylase OafA/YrhL
MAALAVVLHHAINYGNQLPSARWLAPIHAVLDQGYLGVPLFFVISGFCIHLRWAKQYAATGQGQVDFIKFWGRRLHRLYPPYMVALVLSMALVLAIYLLGKDLPLVTQYPLPRLRWITLDFFAHLTMLHGLHPVFNKGGGNPPFWTLAREEYFYIMYFGLLAARYRWGVPASLIGVTILSFIFPLLFLPWLAPNSDWWQIIDSSAIVLWSQWVLGFAAVEAYFGIIKLPLWCRAGWAIPLWAVAAFVLNGFYAPLTAFLWGMTFFSGINYCVGLESTSRWPENRLINWFSGVGVFSYSLYLVHNPVKSIVKQLMGPLGTTTNPVLYVVATIIISIVAYYSGKVFFALVESRFLHMKSAKRAPVQGISAPVGGGVSLETSVGNAGGD